MIYENSEIHNIEELIPGETEGGVCWSRLPKYVFDKLESDMGRSHCMGHTGVELCFVMDSDTVTIRMKAKTDGVFHVCRGSIQGGWEDHEAHKTVGNETEDYVIKKTENLPLLKKISSEFGHPFSPEVIRVIFDRGSFELIDIIGDIEPPKREQIPEKTLLCYGSSITHGSNSIDMSHSWVSMLAHNLRMDTRNLGIAGACMLESIIAEYIADEGAAG